MVKMAHGIVHGRMIELSEDLGIAEGEQVEVSVRVVSAKQNWGEGLRRCAGAMAAEWTEDDDRILEQIYRERKQDPRKELPDE